MTQLTSKMRFLCLLFFFFSTPIASLTLTEKPSPSLLAPQDGEINLSCTADAEFDLCKWTQTTTSSGGLSTVVAECSISKDDVNAKACSSEPRMKWRLDPADKRRCGIAINNADRARDAGEYKCSLVRLSGDSQAEVVAASVVVDVAAQASVSFGGTFSAAGTISVRAGEMAVIECHARGGYPDPVVQVAMGTQEGVIDERSDVTLEESSDEDQQRQRTSNNDGTADFVRTYMFLPGVNDCGKFVKCEAMQRDPASGKLLFDRGQSVKTKKIKVTFPPLAMESGEFSGPFTFSVDQEEPLQIDLTFRANPMPDNNQAIWHQSPTQDIGPEANILQAGDTKGKYEALPLNRSDHNTVTATLLIHGPDLKDETFYYMLHVRTDQGEMSYPFRLQSLSSSNWEDGGHEDHPEAQQAGASTGTIVAIVVIVVGILLVVGFVFWAKGNDKLCFKPYNPSEEKQKKSKSTEARAATAAAAAGDADLEAQQPMRGADDDEGGFEEKKTANGEGAGVPKEGY